MSQAVSYLSHNTAFFMLDGVISIVYQPKGAAGITMHNTPRQINTEVSSFIEVRQSTHLTLNS